MGAALQADGVAVRKRHAQEAGRLQAQLAAAQQAAEGLEAQQAAQVCACLCVILPRVSACMCACARQGAALHAGACSSVGGKAWSHGF